MSLTYKQRFLRPILNFLVERYFPTGAFFGNSEYLKMFERHDKRNDSVTGRAAAMMLIMHVRDNDAIKLDVDVIGHTSSGIPTGDWIVSVKQVKDADGNIVDHTPSET